jgi:hypothetical protein
MLPIPAAVTVGGEGFTNELARVGDEWKENEGSELIDTVKLIQ